MRRLLLVLVLVLPGTLYAQEAPPPVPQAVRALQHLETKPNRGPTSWTNGPYIYDAAGNISRIGIEAFLYDKVGRLENATLRGPDLSTLQTQSFTYDEYGNLTSTAKLGQIVHLDVTFGTNSLSGVEYDAAGNVITAGAQHFGYDALSMRNTVRLGTDAQPRIIYAYTADDERLFAFDVGTGTTHWTLRGFDNKVLRDFRQEGNVWSVERDYVYRDGLLLAALKAGGAVEHYSLDHLGTPRFITNGAGIKAGYHVYWPFGEEWSPGNPQEGSPLKFTGHERDEDPTGGNAPLDSMHARMYAGRWGRFLSVDPKYDDDVLFRPQKWNRYSYGANNPIRHVDPDGRGVYDFVEGTANGWSSSNLGNINRVSPRNVDYQRGQMVGDAAAAIQGFYEMAIGGQALLGAGSAELLTDGAATPVAVPVAVGGLILVTHGGATAAKALNNLSSATDGGRSGGSDRNPAQDKRLSAGEIKQLQKAGHDVHEMKGGENASKYDLFKDKDGNVYVKPKDGKGPGEETGVNLNTL